MPAGRAGKDHRLDKARAFALPASATDQFRSPATRGRRELFDERAGARFAMLEHPAGERHFGIRQRAAHVDPWRGFGDHEICTSTHRAEPGCLQYDLHAVDGDADRFVRLERRASPAALAAHDVTPHMIAADARNPSFRAGPATVWKLAPEPLA